jgi:ferredoxin
MRTFAKARSSRPPEVLLLFEKESIMAYKIIASQCTACSACEPECPNVAIREKNGTFVIDPKKCTECLGHFDEPQCVAVCPVENTCVIDKSYPRYQAPA